MALYAAAGRIDITEHAPEKVHDPVYAKLLLLRGEKETVMLISLDYICLGGGGIGHISDAFYPQLKTELEKRGVQSVLCGTTHTHTPTDMVCGENEILQLILEKLTQLEQELEPVTIGTVNAHENSFILNRSIKKTDGKDWTVRMAHTNPPTDAYESLVFADDTTRIIRLDRADHTPLCVLFNFGCHPLVGFADCKTTANYPGIAEQFIEEHTGAVAMMFQSTAGDVIELNFKDFFHPKDCTSNGMALGQTVVRSLRNLETTPCDVASFTVTKEFPLRKDIPQLAKEIEEEQLELCRGLISCGMDFESFIPLYLKYLLRPQYPLDYKYRYLKEEQLGITQLRDQDKSNEYQINKYLDNIHAMEKMTELSARLQTLRWHQDRLEKLNKDTFAADVTGIRIGDSLILSAPVEPLTQMGQQLYQRYPHLNIFLAGYANGYIHYGATADKYAQCGYEICECDLDPAWLEVYWQAADEIVQKLYSK